MPFDFEGRPAAQVILRDVGQKRAAERAILRLNTELEARVRQRTTELDRTNRELETFSYSVAHDLRAPLRAINGFATLLRESLGASLSDDDAALIRRVVESTDSMGRLIDGLLSLARLDRVKPNLVEIDLSAIARTVVGSCATGIPRSAVAAANPATSPTTPPPNARTVVPRSTPIASRASTTRLHVSSVL